jgi:hypothetical protein
MSPKALCCNLAWFAAQTAAFRRFHRALQDPGGTQLQVLHRILRANANTAFGRDHAFSGIRTAREYQERVPLSSYEDYLPALARIRAGEPNILTASPVRRLAVTSGSSSAVKLVPYTACLQREFSAAIGPWVHDLFRSDPDLMAGPAFWSVTPALTPPDIESAVPVGFDEDTDYLGGFWKPFVDAALAVPGAVSRIRNTGEFQRATLLHLLQAQELRLISVWHPSFLTLLLEHMAQQWDLLLPLMNSSSRRSALRACGPRDLTTIWPKLKLISCWADGPAALAADSLRRTFPNVRLQPKGLLATEAFVSIPFAEARLLAVTSHFFEFLDARDNPHLAEELSPGTEYSVVVTTGGGLYRYRLRDRVRVTGKVARTPALEFIGRAGGVADLFGEKLNEDFVAGVVTRVLADAGTVVKFAMLAPQFCEDSGRYTLFLETDQALRPGLAQEIEQGLRANPHYALCISLGQLRPARVERILPGAFERYTLWRARNGTRLGNIKPALLSAEPNLGTVLRGSHPVS